jgi:hypothetical protein
VFLGEPEPGSGSLSSPVCYADEQYFGPSSSGRA